MKGRPKFRKEKVITVGEYFERETVLTIPEVKEESRKMFGCDVGFARNESNV